MQLKKIAAALIGAFAIAGSASAVTFEGASGTGVVTDDFTGGSIIAFGLDFASLGSTTLNFMVEAADVGSTLSFSSIIRNMSGLGFSSISFMVNGATVSGGTVHTDGFQFPNATGSHANGAWATFGFPGLTTEGYFGDYLLNGQGQDWNISLVGLNAGDTFSIMVAVPEPEQYAMLLAGLGVIGAVARRRKQG